MTDDRTARLAAIDQELAGLDARLDRNQRRIARADVIMLCITVAVVAYLLTARPSVGYRQALIPWAVLVLDLAGNLFQGRMLRGYRAEICDLRSRVR